MAWERRGHRLHYYVAERHGNRVKKYHLGAAGTPAAEMGARAAEEVKRHRAMLREWQQRLKDAESAVIALRKASRILARETLQAAGYQCFGGHVRFTGEPGRPRVTGPTLRERVDPEHVPESAWQRPLDAAIAAIARLEARPANTTAKSIATTPGLLMAEISQCVGSGALPAERLAAAVIVLALRAMAYGESQADGDPWLDGWITRAQKRLASAERDADQLRRRLDRRIAAAMPSPVEP